MNESNLINNCFSFVFSLQMQSFGTVMFRRAGRVATAPSKARWAWVRGKRWTRTREMWYSKCRRRCRRGRLSSMVSFIDFFLILRTFEFKYFRVNCRINFNNYIKSVTKLLTRKITESREFGNLCRWRCLLQLSQRYKPIRHKFIWLIKFMKKERLHSLEKLIFHSRAGLSNLIRSIKSWTTVEFLQEKLTL